MVMVSGTVTSRTSFSFGSSLACPFSHGTFALFISSERGHQGEAAAVLLDGAARRLWRGCGPGSASAATGARGLFLVRLEHGPWSGSRGLVTKALLRLLL